MFSAKQSLNEQSPLTALIIWIFITISVICLYLIIHTSLGKSYKTEVKPLINQSVAIFSIGPTDNTGQWHISLEGVKLGSPISEETLKKTPLDLGNFASFRGKINQMEQQLNSFNQIVEANFLGLLQQSNNLYKNSEKLISLKALGINSFPSEAYIGIPTSAIERFTNNPSISNLSTFLSYVERGPIYQSTPQPGALLPASTSAETETTTSTNAPQPQTKSFSERPSISTTSSSEITPTNISAQRIEAATQSALDLPIYIKLNQSLPPQARAEALAHLNHIWKAGISTFDLDPAIDASTIDSPEKLQITLNQSLQHSLVAVADSETGYFFLIGNYRWLDIAFFAIFGVIIQANIRLIRFNGEQKKDWKGNLLILSIAKLFYAPILVIVVFFVINLISAPEASLQFSQSSLAQLGIAAILGMHPHTAYRLLRTTLKTILSQEIAEPTKKEDPIHEKKSKAIQLPPPKTVSQLKSNIQEIANNTITR